MQPDTKAIPKPQVMKLKSDPCICTPVRKDVEEMACRLGFDDKATGELGLCVNEALANVIRHAYGNKHDQPVEIEISPIDGGIRINIRDWGNGLDPTKLPPKPHDPEMPGGLGLICLRSMMDKAEFTPQAGGGMLLTIEKLRPTG
jgi:serine/threonine-protein kinase RsbW